MGFTDQHLLRIDHLIGKSEEYIARQRELIEELSRKYPQLVDEAQNLLANWKASARSITAIWN